MGSTTGELERLYRERYPAFLRVALALLRDREHAHDAVQEAFASSYALQNPQDSRQIVFTILPGHGVVIVEKWIEDKSAFEVIWEAMDQKVIEITNMIPQGPFLFETYGQRCQISGDSTAIDSELPHPHEH